MINVTTEDQARKRSNQRTMRFGERRLQRSPGICSCFGNLAEYSQRTELCQPISAGCLLLEGVDQLEIGDFHRGQGSLDRFHGGGLRLIAGAELSGELVSFRRGEKETAAEVNFIPGSPQTFRRKCLEFAGTEGTGVGVRENPRRAGSGRLKRRERRICRIPLPWRCRRERGGCRVSHHGAGLSRSESFDKDDRA